jgi:hypothetical protein
VKIRSKRTFIPHGHLVVDLQICPQAEIGQNIKMFKNGQNGPKRRMATAHGGNYGTFTLGEQS